MWDMWGWCYQGVQYIWNILCTAASLVKVNNGEHAPFNSTSVEDPMQGLWRFACLLAAGKQRKMEMQKEL